MYIRQKKQKLLLINIMLLLCILCGCIDKCHEDESSNLQNISEEETPNGELGEMNQSDNEPCDIVFPTAFAEASIFFTMQYADEFLYEELKEAYAELDFSSDTFEYTDQGLKDVTTIYNKFMENELQCIGIDGNKYLFSEIEYLDISNGYEFVLHEMTGDSVPELCIRTFGGRIFIFFYDEESDCLKIWKEITDTSYYIIIGNGNMYWDNLDGDYQFMHFNESGEIDLLVTVAIPYNYNVEKDMWEKTYLVTFPECNGREYELLEKYKSMGIYDGTRYYFRVSEEQFNELIQVSGFDNIIK